MNSQEQIKLLREALKAMINFAADNGCGLKIADDALAATEQPVQPSTIDLLSKIKLAPVADAHLLLDELQAAKREIAELKRILDGIPQDAIDGGWTAKGICQYAKSLEDQIAELKQSQQDDARDAELEVGQDVRESLASMFGKDPVAWINKDRTYVEISTKATVYGSHTIPLYEASKISGES